MKFVNPSTIIAAVTILAVIPSCEEKKKTVTEEVKENVNDALDRRPNEKLKDAAEDIHDAVKDAAKDTKDAVKDAAEETKDAVKDANK
jgi:hypothetical protein